MFARQELELERMVPKRDDWNRRLAGVADESANESDEIEVGAEDRNEDVEVDENLTEGAGELERI